MLLAVLVLHGASCTGELQGVGVGERRLHSRYMPNP